MKAHKITLLIVDHDNIGKEEIQNVIQETNYPNDCISPKVMKIETADIGEWSDNHPLNNKFSMKDEFERLFNTNTVPLFQYQSVVNTQNEMIEHIRLLNLEISDKDLVIEKMKEYISDLKE